MLLDALVKFSDEQAVTAAAASTNEVDLGAARNIGVGERLFIVVVCDVAMTDGSSDSTLDVYIQTSTTEGSGHANKQLVGTFPAVSAAGTVIYAAIDPNKVNEQYMRLYYDPQNGNLTTGTFSAYLTHDVQAFTAYADNITISG